MSFFSSGGHLQLAQREFLFEGLLGAEQQSLFALQVAGASFFEVLFQAFQALLNLRQVADHQVELDVFDVAQGIDGADMGNRIVLEGAQHVDQRIHVAQAGEERGFFQRFLADGGYVNIFNRGVGGLFR